MSIKNLYPNIEPSLNLSFALTKALDSRVTFARASTARLYDGRTVAKAEENLLIRSQEFDNAGWAKDSSSATANTTTAPDGTNTADTLTATAGTARRFNYPVPTNVSVSGLSYFESIFVKAGTHNFVQLAVANQAADFANFDLSSGTIGTTGGTGSSATIISVGNSWYRIAMPYTAGGTNRDFTLGIISSDTAVRGESWTAVGTETVFVWGAQLEQRSAVTAYTSTTTQPITNYIPALQTAAAGVARFDHNPITGESLGLLIEEQRVNLSQRSEEFENAYWTANNGSVAANAIVSPAGTLTADKYFADATANLHRISTTTGVTASASTAHTATIYAKQGEHRYLAFGFSASGSEYTCFSFDLQAGTVGQEITAVYTNRSAAITPVGNGWYRCQVTATIGTTGSILLMFGGSPTATWANASRGFPSYTGDGYSGIFIWGAQLEVGAFPTSYIPTTTAQVTRSADAASMTGANFSSWYRADEGTVYSDYTGIGVVSGKFPRVYAICDGTQNNSIRRIVDVQFSANAFSVAVNNATQASLNAGAPTNNTRYLAADAYKVNDFAASVNAGTVGTDTSGSVPVVNRLEIGAEASTNIFSGHIRKLSYYPRRIANAQLQALTQN
jgi:hypothetical protein